MGKPDEAAAIRAEIERNGAERVRRGGRALLKITRLGQRREIERRRREAEANERPGLRGRVAGIFR